MALPCVFLSFEIPETNNPFNYFFSNDFGERIRHSAVLQLTLDLDVLLVLS